MGCAKLSGEISAIVTSFPFPTVRICLPRRICLSCQVRDYNFYQQLSLSITDPSTVTNASVPPSCEAVNDTQFNCSDSFYFDTSLGLCRLSCGFSPHKNILSREGLRSIGIFATVMLLLFSVINLLSALTFQRKVM